jgi:hypothetical protein
MVLGLLLEHEIFIDRAHAVSYILNCSEKIEIR